MWTRIEEKVATSSLYKLRNLDLKKKKNRDIEKGVLCEDYLDDIDSGVIYVLINYFMDKSTSINLT